jgi:hypothetical protein
LDGSAIPAARSIIRIADKNERAGDDPAPEIPSRLV